MEVRMNVIEFNSPLGFAFEAVVDWRQMQQGYSYLGASIGCIRYFRLYGVWVVDASIIW